MMPPASEAAGNGNVVSPATRTPEKTGRSPGAARSSQFTAYSQALFDASYRSHLMRCMVNCTRIYGRQFTVSILRDLVQILSDLVHMSNKFIVQLMDCDGLECFSTIGLFSYYRVNDDDFQFNHEDGNTTVELCFILNLREFCVNFRCNIFLANVFASRAQLRGIFRASPDRFFSRSAGQLVIAAE